MENIIEFINQYNILISALILGIAYVFIAWEKLPKVTIALFGAAITLALGLLGKEKLVEGTLNPEYYINFIDFNVIFLLVSMMIIVNITTESGIFDWIAIKMLKYTKGQPIIVLFALALFTAIASAFLDNVTTVILIMPITFIIAKSLDVSPIPYLITEIMASNIGGTSTLIGDPPNIIIGSTANLSFISFIKELTPIIALIFLVCISVLIFIFRKSLISDKEKMLQVASINSKGVIKNKPLMFRSCTVMGLVILGFILHDIIHFPVSIIAMIGASFLLLFERPDEILDKIEWNTIFFFIGLFIIIGGFEASGGIALMAKWLLDVTNGSQTATSLIIIWASGILSGVIDNIPFTATMSPMILQIQNVMGADYAYPLWWSLSLGACLGGNMTIIGAAANVIVSENAAAKGYPIKFMYFLKFGVLITIISLILSTIYIYFKFLTN